MSDERVHVTPDVPVDWNAPSAVVEPTRCISCGRLPSEEHCSICHRVARACGDPEPWSKIARSLALIADAIGYPDTAKEMKALAGDVNSEEVNQ